MEVSRREDTNYIHISIRIDGSEWIYVEKSKHWAKDEWAEAKINWSAIGASNIEVTEKFGKALKTAIKEAKKLDKERSGKFSKV